MGIKIVSYKDSGAPESYHLMLVFFEVLFMLCSYSGGRNDKRFNVSKYDGGFGLEIECDFSTFYSSSF